MPPRDKPAASARERILEAADRLFYRDGIRAAGVDTIIAEAGVAKMTLYAHFKSKDDLIAAYLRRRDQIVCAGMAAAVERFAAQSGDWLDALFAALKEWFVSPDFRGCAFINATAELPDPNHPGRIAVAEHKRNFTALLAEVLRKAGVQSPQDAAEVVALLIDGAIVAAVRDSSPAAADNALATTKKLLGRARVPN
ncbi:TetR/AcrR family transcriptional regulator [Frigoriglobus tundricola]|uniref:Transcriptional regulator, AcrR family n=1 Tax=Frigoriglobus tundricola TaxID=2774151 RepID=A0A6M5YZY9_9BACT|nr:TetR/AcrR family transcriptional regulator [Frigoriglobus tundricola]QJW99515.1 Transcriptional regulator, AcrR family [Frigoriglobus tundricola]